MSNKLVTILVPNYKTVQLTKLCLRLLKKHTDLDKVDVIVIDNDSQDESVDYLRTLDWITLIERAPESDDNPALSHSRALDLAMAKVSTPYVLSIHTDTFVSRPDWLDFLINEIEKSPNIAAVGSWKLEFKTAIERAIIQLERFVRKSIYPLIGKTYRASYDDKSHYLRSHCAMYKVDLLRQHKLTFSTGGQTAGQAIHYTLRDLGYDMVFIANEKLIDYLRHLNHATMILNPELGGSKKLIKRGMPKLKKALAEIEADKILSDSSLD